MTEVLMPERRNVISKFVGMFQQGASIMKDGGEALEGGKSLWDKFSGTGAAAGAGGAGGGAAAPAAVGGAVAPAAEATSFMDIAGAAAPYAAPVAAGIGTYQDMKATGGQNSGPIGTSPRARQQQLGILGATTKAGRDINSEVNRFTGNIGLGLTEEQPDRMGSIERRYSSQQNAQRDIDAAREALDTAGLPTEERRSIAQKLEKARQKIGGAKRGSTSYA